MKLFLVNANLTASGVIRKSLEQIYEVVSCRRGGEETNN